MTTGIRRQVPRRYRGGGWFHQPPESHRAKTTPEVVMTGATTVLIRRVLIAGAGAALVLAGTGTAANADHSGTTSKRPATARIGDEENGMLVFVNKSRAALCTPERIAYEQAFIQ